MAGSGNSSDSSQSVSLTAKTPIFGLKLYVVIAATIASLIAIFVVIFLFIRSHRNSKRPLVPVKRRSGFLPLVCKEIREVKDLDRKEGLEIVGFQKNETEKVEICSVQVPSRSDESSTSQSDASTVSAEGLNAGWGRWYSLKVLEIATNGFAVRNVIGEGGYGIVYRGTLHDGSVVAVKNLLNNK